VLTARCDPPLPPRLRNRGSVTEIRACELCFTVPEAQAFLGQFSAEPIAAQAVAGLVWNSEGWAVALRLAAMLIHQRQDAAVLDKALQICERSLLDYLDAEVIGHLPGEVQAFLARTSILSYLNAELCDAILGEEQHAVDSEATLRMLAGNGVFIEQIDEAGDWFRYHELFRNLLQRRLWSKHPTEEIDLLTRRARVWQEQHEQEVRGQSDVLVRREMPGYASPGGPTGGAAALPTVIDGFGTMRMAAPPVEARAVQRAQSQPATGQQARVLLTYREMDVLALLCERLTNKEIAYKLRVSPETVRQHTVNVYRKLGVAGRRQAVVQAQALGLMAPPVDGVQAALPPQDCRGAGQAGMGR